MKVISKAFKVQGQEETPKKRLFCQVFYIITRSCALAVRYSMISNLTYPEKVFTFVNDH